MRISNFIIQIGVEDQFVRRLHDCFNSLLRLRRPHIKRKSLTDLKHYLQDNIETLHGLKSRTTSYIFVSLKFGIYYNCRAMKTKRCRACQQLIAAGIVPSMGS
ncbi:hypothetical protein O9929_12340 [Vibrio lentus]|nr:hypothetical protein [Vibrio lentus]